MKRLLTLILMLCVTFAAEAKLTLSDMFGNGAVLQQNTKVKMWGTSEPRSTVTVTPSWNGTKYECKADKDGNWSTYIETPEGGYTAYSISVVSGNESIDIVNVLAGEVWLASGQSNMEMPMRGFFNCPVEHAGDFVTAAPAKDKIRMITVPLKQSHEPLTEFEGTWKGAEPATIPEMSATAFFFAHKLNQVLDIPVGIVACPYGGARVESWLPKEILEEWGTEDLSKEAVEAMAHYLRPYMAYNAMLNPIKGYTVKGFIWYQGCSNVGKHEEFPERMTTMINHWRECWGDTEGNLPFYMVEIAPYRYKPATEVSYASLLRQAQHQVAHSVKNSGIVVTNDLVEDYEKDNIHPAKKLEVGERLARLALNRNYGFSTIACESPEAVKCYRMSSRCEIAVEIKNAPNGLDRWMEIEGLEVAGSEGIFYPVDYAYYEWEPRVLRIRSEHVFDPCEVRYGWGDFNPGNLKNTDGLPLAPFWLKIENK